jgi:glucose-6-phosphate 1-epimerase
LSVQYEKGAGSNEKMRFHALLHNYIRVPDVTTSSVSGLKGVRYMDKNANKQIFTEESESIVSKGQASDRVYQGGAPEVILSANDASGKQVRVSRTQTFPDTTVWNPAEEGAKGMKDLHEGGWKEYICIEPGQVSSLAELQAGNEVRLPTALLLLFVLIIFSSCTVERDADARDHRRKEQGLRVRT